MTTTQREEKMLENIRVVAQRFIYETGQARMTTHSGRPGILFMDENEFIPFDDLGYNSTYGFFRRSALPGVESEYSNENPWMLHPVQAEHDDWSGYAIVDDGEHAFLIGEDWQLADMLAAIQAGINGRIGETLFDNDEAFGVRYLSIAEACALANQYDPAEYPYGTPDEQDRLRRRIQQNIRRGNIFGVRQDPQGFYRIRETAFRGWLSKRSGAEA